VLATLTARSRFAHQRGGTSQINSILLLHYRFATLCVVNHEDGINNLGAKTVPPFQTSAGLLCSALAKAGTGFSVVVFDSPVFSRTGCVFESTAIPNAPSNHGPDDFHLYSSCRCECDLTHPHRAVANSNSVPATVMVAYVDGQQIQVAQSSRIRRFQSARYNNQYLSTVTVGTHRFRCKWWIKTITSLATPEEASPWLRRLSKTEQSRPSRCPSSHYGSTPARRKRTTDCRRRIAGKFVAVMNLRANVRHTPLLNPVTFPRIRRRQSVVRLRRGRR